MPNVGETAHGKRCPVCGCENTMICRERLVNPYEGLFVIHVVAPTPTVERYSWCGKCRTEIDESFNASIGEP